MSDEKVLDTIDALDAPPRLHDPHGLIHLMRALVTGVDVTNPPNAEGDPNRRRAFKYLREDELLRNGKRTKAGAAAAPVLMELTRLDDHPAKPYARLLLVDLLANDHLQTLTTGLDVADGKTKRRYARGRGRDILDLLVADADRVIDELDDPRASIRSSASFLLGFLSPVAVRSFDRLVARGQSEEDPWVKASVMLATALVARYRGHELGASDLEAWCDGASPIPGALAWVTALYSDASERELEADELPDERAEALVTVLSMGDPDPRLFPWATGQLDKVIAWQLAERGEAATLFGAEVLARASRQDLPCASRYALEALRSCFEEKPNSPRLDVTDLDGARKRVVSELSRRDYSGVVAFAFFGLPASPADRRRWLGETAPTVLDRLIEVDGQGEMKLGERLRQVCMEIGERDRELQKQRRKSRKKLPPRESLDRRGPVLAELRAHATGIDLLEALCFLACGAHNLAGRPIKSDDVYPVLEETHPPAQWLRTTLEALTESRGNLRGSGVGMALLSSLARRLPEGELLPDEYDDLLQLTPTDAANVVMRHLSQERRDALAVRFLERGLTHPLGVHPFQLRAFMELDDDLVTPAAVAELALRTADGLENSDFATNDPEAAEELRARVVARYGQAEGSRRP